MHMIVHVLYNGVHVLSVYMLRPDCKPSPLKSQPARLLTAGNSGSALKPARPDI